MKSTFQELELENGAIVKLTLNFARLFEVKNKRNDIYSKYNKIFNSKEIDNTFDAITILYTAYLCGNVEDIDNAMSEKEFMELIPQDFSLINYLAQLLTNPKSKKNLEKPL